MFKFCWSNHFQIISPTFQKLLLISENVWLCYMSAIHVLYHKKSLQILFYFCWTLHTIRSKLVNAQKAMQKKGKKEKNCKNSIGGQWQLEWPMLWRIMIVPKHNQDIYKWVNSGKIFFWNELLLVLSSLQKSEFLKLIILFFH